MKRSACNKSVQWENLLNEKRASSSHNHYSYCVISPAVARCCSPPKDGKLAFPSATNGSIPDFWFCLVVNPSLLRLLSTHILVSYWRQLNLNIKVTMRPMGSIADYCIWALESPIPGSGVWGFHTASMCTVSYAFRLWQIRRPSRVRPSLWLLWGWISPWQQELRSISSHSSDSMAIFHCVLMERNLYKKGVLHFIFCI